MSVWIPTLQKCNANASLLELSARPLRGYSFDMSSSAGTGKKYVCMQCEATEEKCICEKFCCLCQSQIDVRLCQDGLFYCPPCREACEYTTSS